MGDADNALLSSKKRVADKQLSRDDDPDAEDDVHCQETGTFQRASNEVLASRRILKVRRNTTSSGAANPFADIRLVPPTQPSVVGEATAAKGSEANLSSETGGQPPVAQEEGAPKAKYDASDAKNMIDAAPELETKTADATLSGAKEVCETAADASVSDEECKGQKEAQPQLTEATKENGEGNNDYEREPTENAGEAAKEENAKEVHENVTAQQEPPVAVNSFQQLSSTQNAFAGVSGTGFSSSSFSFGFLPKPGTSTTTSFGATFSSGTFGSTGPLFGTKVPGSDGSSPSNVSNGGASIRLFGTAASDNVISSGSGLPALQEIPVETGEEKEKAVFVADAVLFEYIGGTWKERGKGELKVNLSTTDPGKARLVMRSKGNYRLILNANLFADMKLANMDKRGITFACVNSASEAKESLSTFAVKFKDSSIVEQFRGVVETNKVKSSGDLKTPENSPKASEV